MGAPSYTYSLTNGAVADASQVTQNFNDILNGVTDGTKDITVNALTANGTANLKGPVNLGDAAADDISHLGSLATSIPIKANTLYDIGSSTLGLRAIYLGGTSTFTAKVLAATQAASRIYTVPDAGADANVVLSEGAATINGAKTFGSAIIVGGNTTGDSNLGTITTVSLGAYYRGTFSATFLQTGAYTQTVTIKYIRVGDLVTLTIPSFVTTASASEGIVATTAIPSSLRPISNCRTIVPVVSAGAVASAPGCILFATTGTITLLSSIGEATFPSGSLAGLGFGGSDAIVLKYPVN